MNSFLMTLEVGDFCCLRALSVLWAGFSGCYLDGCSSFCYKGLERGTVWKPTRAGSSILQGLRPWL